MNDDATCAPEPAQNPPAETSASRCRPYKLTDEHKAYVARRLAAYDGPSEIARDMRRQFGIEISRQAITQYDPTRAPEHCGKKRADLFFRLRKAHMREQGQQAVKSRKVERMVLRAVEMIAERVVRGVDAETRDGFARRPETSDVERLRRLRAFIDALKNTDPIGFAAIRRALLDEQESPSADSAAASAPGLPHEAPHG